MDRADDALDVGCGPDFADGIVVFLVVIVGIPFLLALGELLILVVHMAAGIVGRVVFRRPWRASGRTVPFVAARLAAGGNVPTQAEVELAATSDPDGPRRAAAGGDGPPTDPGAPARPPDDPGR